MRKYFFILFIVGFLLYLPSLTGPFVWDDEDFVYANQNVANFKVIKFFTDSVTSGRGKPSNYFRPIQQISYATVHQIFGFNPFWFHLSSILIHIFATCAIFYFWYLLLNRDHETDSKQHRAPPIILSFSIAIIFLVHPIQTEAVSYISGVSDPLFVFFGFLCLIFFLLRSERKNMIPLSILFFVLSMLSKETGFVFLPILILLSLMQSRIKDLLLKIMATIKETGVHFISAVIYLWYHLTYINSFDIRSAWGNNAYSNSLLIRLLTFVQSLFTYVQLLIFPKGLFMERDYSTHIQTAFFNPYLLIFISINISLIFIIYKFRHRLRISNFKFRILLFCYFSFFVSFIPYTGIVLINGIFYEHFLYLPMVFFFAFWIILFSNQIWQYKKITITLFFVIVIILIIRNLLRQQDWTNATRFYSQTISHAPKSIRIINGLGMSYANDGNFDSALRTYSEGISLDPTVPNFYHNAANVFAAEGKTDLAEEYFLKAIAVDPNFLFSWQSLAKLYQETNQTEKFNDLVKKFNSRKN